MKNDIRVIGFDLDQTLYPKSPKIDAAIQEYIYKKIATHRDCSVEEGKRLFSSYYPKISGRKTLLKLGMKNAEEIIQEALANADIMDFLSPSSDVHTLLKDIKKKFGTLTLITGSSFELAIKKLNCLGIPYGWFDLILGSEFSKSDGTAFRKWFSYFSEKDPSLKKEQFLYIGDRKSTDVDIPLSLGMQAALVNVRKINKGLSIPQYASLLNIRPYLLE